MMDKRETRMALVASAIEAMEAKMALMESATDAIIELASALTRTIKRGGTIYLAGNGGSAADCLHFATELVVRLTGKFERPSLPAVSLTADSALLTAAGNDYGFDHIFARQVEGLVRKNDHLILLSTSGNSANLIQAVRAAKKKGVEVSALLGGNGGKLNRLVARAIVVPSDSVQRIQEEHTFIIHNLVQLIEWDLCG
jgi:D-sedoheptulose 7-phosphate isomerase